MNAQALPTSNAAVASKEAPASATPPAAAPFEALDSCHRDVIATLAKLEELMRENGNVSDERLMLMAALTITDELFDARADVDELLEGSPEETKAAEMTSPRRTAFG